MTEQNWRHHSWAPSVISLIAYTCALIAAWVTFSALADSTPWWRVLVADIVATLVIFALGTLTRNSSLYDPYWSVAPPFIFLAWIFTSGDQQLNAAEAGALALVSLWSLRLTYNCMRRWENYVSEDFRYQDLRAQSGRFFPLVDLFGIQLFPTLLVFLSCLPLLSLVEAGGGITLGSGFAFFVTFSAILVEWRADEEMWAFRKTRTEDNPICTKGLWRLSQHPNYLGEILFWWGLALHGMSATGMTIANLAGALAMTGLFVFISIPLMQRQKREKYPAYEKLTNGIAKLIPHIY